MLGCSEEIGGGGNENMLVAAIGCKKKITSRTPSTHEVQISGPTQIVGRNDHR